MWEYYQRENVMQYTMPDPFTSDENRNGLLRQCFPKHHDFNLITQEQIDFAVHEMNLRPRKTLGYKAPYALFFS